jgi:hypothetical protein
LLHHVPPDDSSLPEPPEPGDEPTFAETSSPAEEERAARAPDDPARTTTFAVRDWLEAVDGIAVPALQRAAATSRAWLAQKGAELMRLEERALDGRPLRFGRENARLLAPLVGMLLLVGAGIHMNRYPDLAGGLGSQQTIDEAGRTSPGPALAGGQVTDVGPARGGELDDYIVARERFLAGLDDAAVHVAVVSFTNELGAEALNAALGDLTVHSIQFVNPVAPDRPLSSNVTGDIARTIEGAVGSSRRMAQEERDQVQMLLDDGSVVDPAFIADYERRVEEMDELLEVLDGDPAIVFAVVVEGPVSDLRSLASDPSVRLVDAAPPETEIAGSGFWGLLPTDEDVASFGHD